MSNPFDRDQQERSVTHAPALASGAAGPSRRRASRSRWTRRTSGPMTNTAQAVALVKDASSYVFSALREGELTLYRGSGAGLEPILLVAPVGEYVARECLKRLENEY